MHQSVKEKQVLNPANRILQLDYSASLAMSSCQGEADNDALALRLNPTSIPPRKILQ